MEDSVLSSLLRINRQRLRALRRELAPLHYVGCMHLILLYISHHPGASQEDIACFHAIDKTSIARDARRLEDLEHIRRELSPGDRRQYQLFLTEEGQNMVARLRKIYDDFQKKLSAGVSEEDWQLLASLLKQLEHNCCSIPPRP